MKEWLKDHVLELAALVVAIVGVKGLTDFWSRLCEMFSLYLAEALFACGLAAITAAIVVVFFIRSWHRRHIAAKDAEISELKKRPTQDRVDDLEQQLAAKDAEISALKMRGSNLATFRMKFKDLGPEDMEWVARVYRAGGKGIEPSDAELARFSNGVAIKEFLRLDAAAHKILLADGVGGMLDGCGDLVAYAMGVVCEQDVAKAEARATAAEAELAERDAEASMLAQDDRILHMDYLTKGLLYAIATGSEFTIRDDDPSYLSSNAKNLDAFQRLRRMGLADYETCGMHEIRWFGTELAAKLVEEHADLFGRAKEEVEEIRRKEGTGSR